MKSAVSIILTVFFALSSLVIFAQYGDVIVFAPKGEQFFLSVNGDRINTEAASRVEASNPGGPSFRIRISFPDPAIREVSKMIFNKPHKTLYFKLGRNSRGVFIIEPESSEYSEDRTTSEDTKTEMISPAHKKDTLVEKPSLHPGKCDSPMSEAAFLAAMDGVTSPPFEPARLAAAKKMAEKNCLTSEQVSRVMESFNMESSRLGFAKFAYSHTYDRENYSVVRESLRSEKSRTDLDRHISIRKGK